jgi:hypothetical protein
MQYLMRLCNQTAFHILAVILGLFVFTIPFFAADPLPAWQLFTSLFLTWFIVIVVLILISRSGDEQV